MKTMKKKYKITSKGDNTYTEYFQNIYGVYTFLYSILDNLENADWDKYPQFDIEDDSITLEDLETKEKFTCNGWHWFDGDDEKFITMPNGKTFYEEVSNIIN